MEKNHLPQKALIHASFPKKNAHFPPGNFYSRVRPPKQMPAASLFQTVPGFLFSHQTFLFALYAAEFPLQSAIDVFEKPFRNVVAIYLPREHTTPFRPFPAGAPWPYPTGTASRAKNGTAFKQDWPSGYCTIATGVPTLTVLNNGTHEERVRRIQPWDWGVLNTGPTCIPMPPSVSRMK